jgi:DNA sulfur modification protein DndD
VFLRYLELVNVGVFANKHRISFEKTSKAKPVTLIGALNGGGKTTILNSLQLALYGNRAFGIERTKKNYKEYLRELKNRGSSPDSSSTVELSFDLRQNGSTSNYRIQRNWRCKQDTYEESFIALKDDTFDEFLSANWNDFIDSILPSRLAHLFFFDGEQIEQMADESSAQILLKTAFKSLLGLDVVERLQEDLIVLERRKKSAIQSPAKQNKILDLELACEREQQKLQDLHQKIIQQQSLLDRQTNEISKLKDLFKEKGGESFEKRESVEKEINELELKTKETSQIILESVSSSSFLVPLLSKLKSWVDNTDLDTLVIHNDMVTSYLSTRDTKLLSKIKALIDVASFKRVKDLFNSFDKPTDKSLHGFSIDYVSYHKFRFLVTDVIPEAKKKLGDGFSILKQLKTEMGAKERFLATTPDFDAIKDLNAALNEKNEEFRISATKLSDLNQVFRQTEIELNSYKKLLNKELETDLENYTTQNHQHRILTFIPKVSATLKEFSEKVLQRHVGALEGKITECFQYLIRKPDFIKKIIIDPTDFRLSLLDEDLKQVPFTILSAGERQILATSILWGLSKVSGRPIPLVIDTPLGRLDSNHRANLVQRYFPSASHQVILLSTDEEIVNGYHESLRPYISKSFLLEFDPKKKCSSIKESYFNK